MEETDGDMRGNQGRFDTREDFSGTGKADSASNPSICFGDFASNAASRRQGCSARSVVRDLSLPACFLSLGEALEEAPNPSQQRMYHIRQRTKQYSMTGAIEFCKFRVRDCRLRHLQSPRRGLDPIFPILGGLSANLTLQD